MFSRQFAFLTKCKPALPVLVCALTLSMLTACAKTQYMFQYHEVEVDQAADDKAADKDKKQTALIWPAPPEKPRFSYIGSVTGETNFTAVEGTEGVMESVVSFLKWIVGLDRSSASPTLLRRPQTGTIDANGRIYVTDVGRHSVMVFDTQKGEMSEWTQAGSEADFKTPIGIAVSPEGKVYVADADWGYVAELDLSGNPTKIIGKGMLKRPTGLAYDSVLHQIYVADTHGHDIKVFNTKGDLVDTLGQRGGAVGEFNSPTHVAFSRGKLYVTDTFNTRVQVLSRNGDVSHQIGQRGLFIGNFIRPKGVATDSKGNIYVIESYADYLLVYNSKGDFLLPIGGTGSGAGNFYLPSGIWTDSKDRIYIADMFNGRVVVLQFLDSQQKL